MRRFGLIGFPLTHSFSKIYFEKKFRAENISDCSYELFSLTSLRQLPDLLIHKKELVGLNVTIPYKESILPFLSEMEETASAVGAVNSISIRNGNLKGYNTDIIGFETTLKLIPDFKNLKALILGNGGSSRAVQFVLEKKEIKFQIVSRHKNENTLTYDEIENDLISTHRLIINCTPVGMFPNENEILPLPFEIISSNHFLIDLIYNPAKTKLMEQFEKRNAAAINGMTMLIAQAEASWKIWNQNK